MIQAMIGQAATVIVEERMPPFQRLQKAGEIRDGHIAGGFEFVHPGVEVFRLMHGQRLVRPVSRINPRPAVRRRERFMIAEVIRRIIRGAKGGDVEFFQDALRAEGGRGELFVGLIPNARGRGFI